MPKKPTSKTTKKNKQLNFFDSEEPIKEVIQNPEDESPSLSSLQMSKLDNKKESRLKKFISGRLEKIKKLNELLEKDKQTLDKMKSMYHEKLSDEVQKVSQVKEIYVRQLIKRYAQKSFTLWQRELLEKLIETNIAELMQENYAREITDELIQAYEELFDEYFPKEESKQFFKDDFFEVDEDKNEEDKDIDENFKDFSKEFEFGMIKMMLENMGIEVDDDFFEGLDPSAEDFQLKLQERILAYTKEREENEKREEKRQKVMTTDKEFTKLYKRLAKKIHPDLTTDEEERKRREKLMQELVVIWENRDYYELLVMQSNIDPDFEDSINLNETHLQQIADDLLTKVNDLEVERYRLKNHPENDFYYRNFYATSDRKMQLFFENYKKKLNKDEKKIISDTTQLKNQKTTKEYLKEVYETSNPWGFY